MTLEELKILVADLLINNKDLEKKVGELTQEVKQLEDSIKGNARKEG